MEAITLFQGDRPTSLTVERFVSFCRPAPAEVNALNRPLRTHLALTYSVLILAFALLLSIFVENAATKRLERQIGHGLGDLAYQIADKLDRGMFERYRDVAVAATMATVPGDGTELSIRREWLEELQITYPYYKWIGFADLTGTVQVSTHGLLENHNVAARPWFAGGLKSVFYGDVHAALLLEKLLPASSEPWRFVDVAVPVRNESGQVVGVLGAHLSWEWANEVRQSVLLPEEAESHEALVVSSANEVLLGPKELVGTFLDLDLLENASATPQHAIEQWPDGKRYLTGVVVSKGHREYPGLAWRVLVRESVETAFAAPATLRWQILGIGALLSVVFFIISWLLAARIARPLQALTAAADRLRAGERQMTLPEHAGYREGEVLARSLKALLGQFIAHERELTVLNTDLESRVKRRTAELEAEISEREQAQRALERSEASLRTITDNIPALTAYLDTTGHIRFANRAFTDWFGIESSSLLGRPVSDFLSDKEYRVFNAYLTSAYAGERVHKDVRGIRDSMPAHMELVLIPDRDVSGTVSGVYMTVQDITVRKTQHLLLAREVRHDALTGLTNRKGLGDRLQRALQRAHRKHEALAVLFLDLDRFKSINDTFGHSAGDELLKAVAQRLLDSVRITDTVARLAGDEFVVVLEGLTDGQLGAQRVAQKIIAAVSEPYLIAGETLGTSTSIGIVVDVSGTTSAETLMRHADEAMYQAKQNGRNTYRLYNKSADAPSLSIEP